jgi:GNAT superfamily N-acetyltransferase
MRAERVLEDSKGRKIVIRVEPADGSVLARHDGKVVGEATFFWHTFSVQDSYQKKPSPELRLGGVHVDQEYQRAGIGTEMIDVAVCYHEEFAIPPPNQNPETRGDWYLTDDGHRLIHHCVKEGVLPESYVKSTGSRPQHPPPDQYQ